MLQTKLANDKPQVVWIAVQYRYCSKAELTMTEAKSTRTVRRGRIFPSIQWSSERKAQCLAEKTEFKQRCEQIFQKLQPELIETHYNWYVAVEPESGEYFINEDALAVAQMVHEKYPNFRLHVFRINETGVCGTI